MPRKRITLALDERYYKKIDLSKAAYEHLTKEGYNCELIDIDTIIIDGYKYIINEWNIKMGMPPLQQVILKLAKD